MRRISWPLLSRKLASPPPRLDKREISISFGLSGVMPLLFDTQWTEKSLFASVFMLVPGRETTWQVSPQISKTEWKSRNSSRKVRLRFCVHLSKVSQIYSIWKLENSPTAKGTTKMMMMVMRWLCERSFPHHFPPGLSSHSSGIKVQVEWKNCECDDREEAITSLPRTAAQGDKRLLGITNNAWKLLFPGWFWSRLRRGPKSGRLTRQTPPLVKEIHKIRILYSHSWASINISSNVFPKRMVNIKGGHPRVSPSCIRIYFFISCPVALPIYYGAPFIVIISRQLHLTGNLWTRGWKNCPIEWYGKEEIYFLALA